MATLPQHPRVSIITQARMTSTRLPGKIMRKAADKSMLQHHIDRLRAADLPIILATTTNGADADVAAFAQQQEIACFRGDEHDVLSRFWEANRSFPADVIVRVTSDCPLIDAELILQGIALYLQLNDDCCYVSNCFPRTFARGFDFEIFSATMLDEAHHEATAAHDREHVTPFMRQHRAALMHNIAQERDNGSLRITLDTPEDLELLTLLFEQTAVNSLGYEAIEEILLQHPQWLAINAHIEQKKQ